MYDWIARSDQDHPPTTGADMLVDRGVLVMEIALPLPQACVLLDYRAERGWPRALSVFFDPEAGLSLLHRQGGSLVRHTLAGPLPALQGTARIIFRWDAPARNWQLRYELGSTHQVIQSRGHNPLPVPLSDLLALCHGQGVTQRHGAVLWFGATKGELPPDRTPWLGLRTPIATPDGYRHAGSLRPGDLVLASDDAPVALRSVQRMTLPTYRHYAPVLLRAPYFAETSDLLVSSDQMISYSGYEVEYLFGEDEVLVEAGHLVDGRSALLETRRDSMRCVSLDVGRADAVFSEGCILATANHRKSTAPTYQTHRVLQAYEALPLLALLRKHTGTRAA